jgi:acetyl-CoA acetyltransferase
MIAAEWHLSRRELEEFALESNRRAIHAIGAGYFDREIVPVGDFRARRDAARRHRRSRRWRVSSR